MDNLGNLIEYLRETYEITDVTKMNGPNGAFISFIDGEGNKNSLPVGGKSQEGKLADYSALEITKEDGTKMVVATTNNYVTEETLSF